MATKRSWDVAGHASTADTATNAENLGGDPAGDFQKEGETLTLGAFTFELDGSDLVVKNAGTTRMRLTDVGILWADDIEIGVP